MSIRPSIYNLIEILTSDQRTIDIRNAVVGVDIYEDVLCPTVSAKLTIANAGGSIEDDNGTLTSLYEGAKLRGGEAVRIFIEPNSGRNVPIDFNTTAPLYIRKVSNLIREEEKEFFEINLISREAVVNENQFLQKSYSKDVAISEHVANIINESFLSTTEPTIDLTANTFGFMGNQMSPFEALIMLASKAVPLSGGGGSASGLSATAGFFFYQTREGFQFRSIDNLISQEVKGEFFTTEQVLSTYTEGEIADCKINFFDVRQNQDIIDKLKKGAYSTDRRYFDPYTFTVDSPKLGSIFSGKDYIEQGAKNLGGLFDPSQLKLTDLNLSFTDVPSQINTATYDLGTISQDVTTDRNFDISETESQAKMRYNTLFTQIVDLQLPLNSYLHAGDIIKITVPKITSGDSKDIDTEQVSGLYMIKELCHHFDSKGSYTALKALRDTYGLYGTNNQESTASPDIFNFNPSSRAPNFDTTNDLNVSSSDGFDLNQNFF